MKNLLNANPCTGTGLELCGTSFDDRQFCVKKQEIRRFAGESYLNAKERFSQETTTKSYPSEYRNKHVKDQREKSAILKALSYLPQGAKVLDLPCGTGRVTSLLAEQGFSVRGADVSPGMVKQAEDNYRKYKDASPLKEKLPDIQFDLTDVMNTSYGDEEFDAVICNRLFHHFTEHKTRMMALRELHRITAHTIIVSFFNTCSFDAKWRRIRNIMKNRKPSDRLPLALSQFQSELESAGFKIIATVDVWKYISQMSYVIAVPK